MYISIYPSTNCSESKCEVSDLLTMELRRNKPGTEFINN